MKTTGAAVLGFLLVAPVQAQGPESAQPVKSSVEAVAAEVEVLVLDSKGVPVEGLTKSDFKLLVNDKEMPIDWFEAPPATIVSSTAPVPVAPAEAPPATAATPAPRPHSTVFVISDLNTDLRARNAGLDALRAYSDRLPEGEPAAIYLLDNGARRLQAFTTDRAALKNALQKAAKLLPRSYIFSQIPADASGAGEGRSRQSPGPQAPSRGDEWVGQSRQMLRNFSTVLESLANRPEPKTVVVLSGPISAAGFIEPIGGTARSRALVKFAQRSRSEKGGPQSQDPSANVLTNGNSDAMRARWNFLGEANGVEGQALLARTTIVAFDPTGLDTPDAKAEINSAVTTFMMTQGGPVLRPPDSSTESDRTDSFEFRSDTLAAIAESTGGERLGFTNKPADLILDESRLLERRYRLGFTPLEPTSARRAIRVEVARPGVIVRTAAGQRSLTPETAAHARFAALLLSADAPKGDFAIAIQAKGPAGKRTDDAFHFDVLVPVSGIYAEERDDGRRARLELMIACVDEEGRASDPMAFPFSVLIDKSAAKGAFFRKAVKFNLDKRWKGRLFVGVRDTATNRLGAVALPIGS